MHPNILAELRRNRSAGGGAFSPGDLTPTAWYDFSDASLLYTDDGITNVTTNGQLIYRADDKMGSYPLKQATSSYRPTYHTNIQNGLSVASVASGAQNLIPTPWIPQNAEMWLYMAIKVNTYGPNWRSVFSRQTVSSPYSPAIYIQDTSATRIAIYIGSGALTTAFAPPTAGTTAVLGFYLKQSTEIGISVDAATIQKVSHAVASLTNWTGIPGAISSQGLYNAHIMEVIMYHGQTLSTTDHDNVVSWINAKWAAF